jgi:NAD+ synthase (glutamine-hydrolysing)
MKYGERPFFDLYAHDFVRTAVAVPRVSLANPMQNAREILRLYAAGAERGAALVLFPELSLSGYSLEDLHQQAPLLRAVRDAVDTLCGATETHPALLVVGAPLVVDDRLFNCAVVLGGGRRLGIVPKTYIPNYREFYEKRQFASARDAVSKTIPWDGEQVPFGNDLLFRNEQNPHFCLHVEVCEDVWVPIPPSTYAALRGATVIANLSASNVTIGKTAFRHQLAATQSAKTLSAYLYSAAGSGESTTDLAWDGQAMVYENGELLAQTERFSDTSELVFADIDLERLVQERLRMSSFVDCASAHGAELARLRSVGFDFIPGASPVPLARLVERFPFVPSDRSRRDERCYETYNIQVSALAQRLRAARLKKVVIGVSGGLDSTHALIVAVKTMDRLGLPRTNVLAYTMPGFATSTRTREDATKLMHALGVTAGEIDIRPSSRQMLEDIEHPYAAGEKSYDVTFENVQAGERTSHLFRLANRHDALVVGTGDLSELALGWCTYGVGDHMSHYNVNCSVPKTLIRYLIQWVADKEVDPGAQAVLRRILAAKISPELVPGDDPEEPEQDTEATIGPYALHDFSLYYITRRGYGPAKVAFLAMQAWAAANKEDGVYTDQEILRWLRVFVERFFASTQFKRSAVPNGPKVGSGGSLSPRGDWRAPSDNDAGAWVAEMDAAERWYQESQSRGRRSGTS